MFTSGKISFGCAKDSPLGCTPTPGSSLPALSYIFSFGEDNESDVYLLTNSGVYRIVRPSRCGYTCANENVSTAASDGPGPSARPSEAGLSQRGLYRSLMVVMVSIIFVCLHWLIVMNFAWMLVSMSYFGTILQSTLMCYILLLTIVLFFVNIP